MGLDTKIAWTDHTFNLAWGCTKISPGCTNCYAEDLARSKGNDVWGPGKKLRTFGESYWHEPTKWNRLAANEERRHRVFCSSMTDWALDHAQLEPERAKLWDLMEKTPWLDWQLLTKRPENIKRFLPPESRGLHGRLWIGVSIESNGYHERADFIRNLPVAVRFVSYEPAIGPLDKLDLDGLDWMIYGGESGAHRRLEDKEWAREMRRRCQAKKIAFYHKQSAGRFTETGILLDGELVREYPTPRRIGDPASVTGPALPPSQPEQAGLFT
jgi:protein gp37